MKVFYHFKVLHKGTERKERKIVKGKWGPTVWGFLSVLLLLLTVTLDLISREVLFKYSSFPLTAYLSSAESLYIAIHRALVRLRDSSVLPRRVVLQGERSTDWAQPPSSQPHICIRKGAVSDLQKELPFLSREQRSKHYPCLIRWIKNWGLNKKLGRWNHSHFVPV